MQTDPPVTSQVSSQVKMFTIIVRLFCIFLSLLFMILVLEEIHISEVGLGESVWSGLDNPRPRLADWASKTF